MPQPLMSIWCCLQAWQVPPGIVCKREDGDGVHANVSSLLGVDLDYTVVIMQGGEPCVPRPYRPETQLSTKDIYKRFKQLLG